MNEHVFEINSDNISGYVNNKLFGFNFEVTRETWYNGIGAQILDNRKLFSYNKNNGIPGWIMSDGAAYTDNGVRLTEGASISQKIESRINFYRKPLICRIVIVGKGEVTVKIKLGNSESLFFCGVLNGTRQTIENTITPDIMDCDSSFTLIADKGEFIVFCLSLMPQEGVVCGLRRDVIDALKVLKPASLRFPGGCYAEYYEWEECLKAPDERKCMSIDDSEWTRQVVLSSTYGQDPQDMSIDDFIAVCRMVGAEPHYTVRLNEKTPEDAVKLIEYANGDESTEYGRLRISRGFKEPYNIKYWYVGNELYSFGRGELKDPVVVAERSVEFARKMKEADTSITLILGCLSGSDWNRIFVNKIKELDGFSYFSYMSFHAYLLDGSFAAEHLPGEINEPYTDEGIAKIEKVLNAPNEYILPKIRAARDEQIAFGNGFEKLPIIYDEWNYCWNRCGHPVMALYCAGMLHMLIRHSNELNIDSALFFHPINEGMIRVADKVTPEDAGLIWKLMLSHTNGSIIELPEDDEYTDILATTHKDCIYITIINKNVRNESKIGLPGMLKNKNITSEGYYIDKIWEKAYCASSLKVADIDIDLSNETLTLPASCVIGLRIGK